MRYRPLLGILLAGALMTPIMSCTNDPSLTQIVISPSAFTTVLVLLPDGEVAPSSDQATVQYTATGYYTHPNHAPITKDITNQVTWFSPTPWMVGINGTGLAAVTGSGSGTTYISASMKGFHGVVGSNQSTFQVQPPASTATSDVTSLSISPSNPTITGTGKSLGFVVFGTTGTGNTEDLTNAATWTSSSTSVATIGAKTGVVTSIATGSTEIVASYANPDGRQVAAITLLTVQ